MERKQRTDGREGFSAWTRLINGVHAPGPLVRAGRSAVGDGSGPRRLPAAAGCPAGSVCSPPCGGDPAAPGETPGPRVSGPGGVPLLRGPAPCPGGGAVGQASRGGGARVAPGASGAGAGRGRACDPASPSPLPPPPPPPSKGFPPGAEGRRGGAHAGAAPRGRSRDAPRRRGLRAVPRRRAVSLPPPSQRGRGPRTLGS